MHLKPQIALVALGLVGMFGCSNSSQSAAPVDGGGTSDAATDAAVDTGPQDAGELPDVGGRVYYNVADDLFRIAASAGAAPENLSEALDALAPGTRDRYVAPSATGDWFVMSSDRGGCSGECLVRVAADLSAIEPVLAGGAEVYPAGISAVSSDGNRVVFATGGGPHNTDLWLTERSDAGWQAPILLTGDSTYAYNNMPAMDREATHVLFDCGQQPYPEDGQNDACRVNLDGSGFNRVVGYDTLPDTRFDKVQNPHPGPDGVLFEGSWPVAGDAPEIIWILRNGASAPEPIGLGFPNSVSPCALADGRWVMLWLGRPGNDAGSHELTLVGRDGSLIATLTPDVDVADIGLGCSD